MGIAIWKGYGRKSGLVGLRWMFTIGFGVSRKLRKGVWGFYTCSSLKTKN